VADDQHHGRLAADSLGVVGDGGVPEQVVAGAEIDHVLALDGADPARQDDVVLVAGVGVQPGAAPR